MAFRQSLKPFTAFFLRIGGLASQFLKMPVAFDVFCISQYNQFIVIRLTKIQPIEIFSGSP
jgi:hypothetical protein